MSNTRTATARAMSAAGMSGAVSETVPLGDPPVRAAAARPDRTAVAFICTHSLVTMAEVVGRPDARLDEVPVAFVEVDEGAPVTADELIEFCRGQTASFNVPRVTHFKRFGEWPMPAVKVNKAALLREVSEHCRNHSGLHGDVSPAFVNPRAIDRC